MGTKLKIPDNISWLKKEKTLIIAGIILAAGLALFVIYPAARDILLVKGEVSSLKSQLLAKQSASYQLRDILASYQKNEAKLEFFNKAVMNKSRELEFITSLENIAARHGLQQKINIENYRELPEGDFTAMPVQLLLQGAFKDEMEYLEDLERLPAYISIKQINITASRPEGAEEKSIGMLIFADTFWQ